MSNADTITGFSDATGPPDNALPRHSELHTLQEIGRSILDSRDLNIIMEGILNKAFDIGRFDIGMICFVTGARQTLELIAHRGFRDRENLSRYGEHIRERSTAGVVDRVLATKEIRVVNLDSTAGIRTFRREGVRSLVIVPLRADEDALGILYLGCREPRQFDPAQIRLLEAVGTQTGIAVQKIRLLEAAERHAREQEALNLIAMATSQSLDPKELLEIAAEKTVEVTGRQRINFRLKDPLTGKGNIVAYRGFTAEEIEALRRIVPHAASDQVFDSGDPLVINDSGEQRVAGILPVTQSVAWIPIKAGLKVVGVLGISDDQSRPFSRNEVELLRAIGNVIGVAIENARLFEQTRKQSAELEKANKDLKRREEIQTLVKELNEDIMRLSIDALMKKLSEKVREILRLEISDVRVRTAGRWKLTGIAGIEPELLTSGRSGTGRGPAGWIDQHRQPLVIPDLNCTALPMGTTMKKLGLRAFIGVPLLSRGGEVIGVLRALSYRPRNFTPDEIDLLQQLANGSAAALENARLLDEIKRQADELEKSNAAKDQFLEALARQKEELSRLNSGLEQEIAERGRAKAEIAAKNRDLETLLYVTSHDLREPLRAIENFSRIVNDRYKEGLDAKGQDFLRRVIQGAQRLNRLLDDILMLSRSQRIGAPTEEVDGESIVLEALRRLEGKISATNAQIRVAKDFHGLRVDKTWATQAVYNLIANALKFTRNGEPPDIEIAPYRPQGPGSNTAGIAVRDRGPGVAPEHGERIFQLFQRAVGREVEGTGAGLAIVRQIAERHGGTARVERREGGGSEFIITFGHSEDLQGGKNE